MVALRERLAVYPEERPRYRAQCLDMPRPCPWVGCRSHLLCDITSAGSIRICNTDYRIGWDKKTIPRDPPGELPSENVAEYVQVLEWMDETCALDVADKDERTLKVVAKLLRVTKERARQLETSACNSFTANSLKLGLYGLLPRETANE